MTLPHPYNRREEKTITWVISVSLRKMWAFNYTNICQFWDTTGRFSWAEEGERKNSCSTTAMAAMLSCTRTQVFDKGPQDQRRHMRPQGPLVEQMQAARNCCLGLGGWGLPQAFFPFCATRSWVYREMLTGTDWYCYKHSWHFNFYTGIKKDSWKSHSANTFNKNPTERPPCFD